ncbi:hypothetical protein KL933_000976 [Ogataea haglerorum]|uniref:Uncharacterized protein n=1 Tax=Ogataea haglerorum TaxID=1937702 RepID=A0AAN6D8G7_9ASCO|nr:hypothetical protein KL933_000976 [Ogataea haglerorum]
MALRQCLRHLMGTRRRNTKSRFSSPRATCVSSVLAPLTRRACECELQPTMTRQSRPAKTPELVAREKREKSLNSESTKPYFAGHPEQRVDGERFRVDAASKEADHRMLSREMC